MTAVTYQRQDWGRGGRGLGKVVKDNPKRDWVEGQNTLKRVITKLIVKLVLRKCLLVFFQGVNGRLL